MLLYKCVKGCLIGEITARTKEFTQKIIDHRSAAMAVKESFTWTLSNLDRTPSSTSLQQSHQSNRRLTACAH